MMTRHLPSQALPTMRQIFYSSENHVWFIAKLPLTGIGLGFILKRINQTLLTFGSRKGAGIKEILSNTL